MVHFRAIGGLGADSDHESIIGEIKAASWVRLSISAQIATTNR
jgi:hypothetical protein